MLVFYAATFGVGILSSGFGNTTHFLQQKTENKNSFLKKNPVTILKSPTSNLLTFFKEGCISQIENII